MYIEVDDDSPTNKHIVKVYKQLLDRLELQQIMLLKKLIIYTHILDINNHWLFHK